MTNAPRKPPLGGGPVPPPPPPPPPKRIIGEDVRLFERKPKMAPGEHTDKNHLNAKAAEDMTRAASILAGALGADRYSSMSTDKLIAIMAGIASIPWDRVKMFKLDWKALDLDDDTLAVPFFQVVMKDSGPLQAEGMVRMDPEKGGP